MPNPKDLQDLQIRQTLTPQRQLLFYSRDKSFMCTIRQGSWVLSIRVVKRALPINKVIDAEPAVIQLDCANEQEGRTTTFFLPAVEYVPAIVR